MKKFNFLKLALDLLMGIIFALLFNKTVLGGLVFHEIAGLAIGFAIIVHLILNWKWIKNVTLTIFSPKVPLKIKIDYIIDILLLLDVIFIIISGIFISKVIFPNLNINSSVFNKHNHLAASYTALLLIGIHMGLHWNWVMSMFKKIVNLNTQNNKLFNYSSKVAVVLILALGLYNMANVNYFSRILIISNFTSTSNFNDHPNNGPIIPYNNNDFKKNQQDNNNSPKANQLNTSSSNGNHGMYNNKPSFGGRGMRGGKHSEGTNILSILSIIGAFTIITYYIEKLPLILKRRTT